VASIADWPFYTATAEDTDNSEQQRLLVPAQAHCLLAEPYHSQMQSSPLLQVRPAILCVCCLVTVQ
jgi:hypothetical protein